MVTIRKELIGSEVKLPYRAISGKILDETRDTFTIKVPGMRKKVLKNNRVSSDMLSPFSVSIFLIVLMQEASFISCVK